MKKKLFEILAVFLLSLSFLILLLLTSMDVVVKDEAFINSLYEKYESASSVGVTEEEIIQESRQLIGYLYGREESPNTLVCYDGEVRPFLNEKEVSHMVDVRTLFVVKKWAQWITGFILIAFLGSRLLLKRGKRLDTLLHYGKNVLLGTVCIILLLGIGIGISFNSLFIRFHELFFSNDLWLLNPETDLLIRMVPEGYFFDIFFRMLVMTAAVMAVLWVLWYVGKKVKMKRNSMAEK